MWRTTLADIVGASVRDDFELQTKIPGVDAPTAEFAAHLRASVSDCGETLVELPEETFLHVLSTSGLKSQAAATRSSKSTSSNPPEH
ncbi:MAG: hypothetical protein DI536_19130 [Archangium gephyra]|uniref:Uncharacterized protein n=1 Tax=Archangium gephyra TaxID=48 RepID=A0A2W5T5N0_9BACT|nr:MAG: hypothetical protein DI536_19130 [Archangium gephyra]